MEGIVETKLVLFLEELTNALNFLPRTDFATAKMNVGLEEI